MAGVIFERDVQYTELYWSTSNLMSAISHDHSLNTDMSVRHCLLGFQQQSVLPACSLIQKQLTTESEEQEDQNVQVS